MKKTLLLCLSLLCFGIVDCQAQEAFPFVAKVTATTANLRAGQNANFESLGQLKKDDQVVVVGESFDWRKVKLPLEAKVYVNAGFIKDLGNGIGEVIGNRLNIRAAALANASIVGQLKKGDLVAIIEKKENWYQIQPPDQSFGWVAKNFIEFQSLEIPAPRLVQAATPKVDVKNPLVVEEIPQVAVNVFTASGVVQDLGNKSVSLDIRHYLQSDGKVYALQGYRHMLDGFLNQKVKIEGKLQPDIKSDNPVVLVTKITFVLIFRRQS